MENVMDMPDYFPNAYVKVDCKNPDGKYCGKCCFETEMLLTRHDISRIKSLGYKEEEFVEVKGGVLKLKNVKGKCVFLDEKTRKCRIYPFRPIGCRLYPLVYNVEEDRVELDPLCPRKVPKSKRHERLVRELVSILARERS